MIKVVEHVAEPVNELARRGKRVAHSNPRVAGSTNGRNCDKLYFFVWREKIVATLGMLVIDLAQMKTTGRIIGYEDFESRSATSFRVGAHVRIPRGA